MREKLDALTSLRFIAAILVVFYHTLPADTLAAWPALNNIRASGFTGVPLFFCLSGFILFFVYETLSRDRAEIVRFLVARVARIYPLYVFSLLVDLPRLLSVRLAGYGFELGLLATGVTLAGQMLMLQVWIPPLGGLNYPSWSVATEAAFYLSFPFAIVFVRKLKTTLAILTGLYLTWVVAILLAAVAPLITDVASMPAVEVLLNRNPVVKFPDFLAGMLLGALWVRWRDLADRIRFLPGAVAVAGAAAWIGVMSAGPEAMGGAKMMTALLLPAFCLLIFGLASRTAAVSHMLTLRPLVFLGETSYAVYLLHAPIQYAFFEAMTLAIDVTVYALYLMTVLAASSAAYLVIEAPFRRLINRLPQREHHESKA